MVIPDKQGRKRRRRDVSDDRSKVVQKRTLWKMNPKNFWDLIHHNDQSDSCFESDQYRSGNKVRDETEPQQRSEQESHAHQKRQRC